VGVSKVVIKLIGPPFNLLKDTLDRISIAEGLLPKVNAGLV